MVMGIDVVGDVGAGLIDRFPFASPGASLPELPKPGVVRRFSGRLSRPGIRGGSTTPRLTSCHLCRCEQHEIWRHHGPFSRSDCTRGSRSARSA